MLFCSRSSSIGPHCVPLSFSFFLYPNANRTSGGNGTFWLSLWPISGTLGYGSLAGVTVWLRLIIRTHFPSSPSWGPSLPAFVSIWLPVGSGTNRRYRRDRQWNKSAPNCQSEPTFPAHFQCPSGSRPSTAFSSPLTPEPTGNVRLRWREFPAAGPHRCVAERRASGRWSPTNPLGASQCGRLDPGKVSTQWHSPPSPLRPSRILAEILMIAELHGSPSPPISACLPVPTRHFRASRHCLKLKRIPLVSRTGYQPP